MKQNEQIKKVVDETLKNFALVSDANCVIGTPVVTANDVTIIPITKMTVAFLSGGGEYGDIKMFQPNSNYPLSTGSGGVVSVKPRGFLIEEKGKVRFVATPDDYIERFTDQLFSFIKGEK